MWTLAATLSTQFQDLSGKLYVYAMKLLHSVDGKDKDFLWNTGEVYLEQVQAWLLIGYYEFIRMEHHHVVLTATCAFRLVQRADLHLIDAFSKLDAFRFPPKQHIAPAGVGYLRPDSSWVIKEERRRTFWVAFCFDRLISAHEGSFFTLHEELVRHSLPYSLR